MLSPHPSYPPLEMYKSGLNVVINFSTKIYPDLPVFLYHLLYPLDIARSIDSACKYTEIHNRVHVSTIFGETSDLHSLQNIVLIISQNFVSV